MLIEFQLEHRTIEVPYDVAIGSEYIKHTVEDTGTNTIIIPSKYSVLIFNYIDFLKGNKSVLTSKAYLRDCFYMYTYFIDPNYFSYLLKQLFNSWSYMFTIVYTDVPVELQREILLFCPYDFLPTQYIQDDKFIKQWTKNNKNVIVTVNNDVDYHVNFETVSYDEGEKNVVNERYINGNRDDKGYIYDTRYYLSGRLNSRGGYKDNKKQGVFEEWYENYNNKDKNINQNSQHGQIYSREEYNNSEKHGICEIWYMNGNLFSSVVYIHDKQEGVWESWYDSGQLRDKGIYADGLMVGLWREWDEDGKITSEGYYDDNNKQGLWVEKEYPYDIMTFTGMYHHNMRQGLWEAHYDNTGKLYSRGLYENNKRIGIWQEWDIDGHVTSIDFTNIVDQYNIQ